MIADKLEQEVMTINEPDELDDEDLENAAAGCSCVGGVVCCEGIEH